MEILAKRDNDPVLVRKGSVMAATFHPELSDDKRVHEEFLKAREERNEINDPSLIVGSHPCNLFCSRRASVSSVVKNNLPVII